MDNHLVVLCGHFCRHHFCRHYGAAFWVAWLGTSVTNIDVPHRAAVVEFQCRASSLHVLHPELPVTECLQPWVKPPLCRPVAYGYPQVPTAAGAEAMLRVLHGPRLLHQARQH